MPTTPLDCNSVDGILQCTEDADCPEECNLKCISGLEKKLCLTVGGPPTSR